MPGTPRPPRCQRPTENADGQRWLLVLRGVRNVLGYAAGSYNGIHHIFPFTKTKAGDVYCAHLKSCFFHSITLLLTQATVAAVYVKVKPLLPQKSTAAADAEIKGKSECMDKH
ncbi:hypothetical protein Ahy_B03g067701 [Arachis hypogaea]|uniref:Uncharacterized protein n=1 Tax=Arachis hypogaea TaxID=3818 RepID=A0A445A7I9_ARAHY|nr:hypothetical protein Ahy_B03g067701 [Arachis hypogaea]